MDGVFFKGSSMGCVVAFYMPRPTEGVGGSHGRQGANIACWLSRFVGLQRKGKKVENGQMGEGDAGAK